MAHALSTEVTVVEMPPSVAEDPLDLRALWPITVDLTDAATRVTRAVRDIACALADDTEAATTPLRQHLLEIRARLIYAYSHICSNIIADTRVLISWSVYTAGATLRNDLSGNDPAHFQEIVEAVISGCSTNRNFVDEIRLAWDAFYVSLSQLSAARSRSSQSGVAAFLRNFGTFASPSASLQAAPQHLQTTAIGADTRDDLELMMDSLERIEVFWRKRVGLFSSAGHTFGREELAQFYQSCQQLGEAYYDFMDPFSQNELQLAHPRPPIVRFPRSRNEHDKSPPSWRDLIKA